MGRNHASTDRKIREAVVDRHRAAAAVKSCMLSLDHLKVTKERNSEIEYEQDLLEQAFEILMKPAAPSPSERRWEREQALDRKSLEEELDLTK